MIPCNFQMENLTVTLEKQKQKLMQQDCGRLPQCLQLAIGFIENDLKGPTDQFRKPFELPP